MTNRNDFWPKALHVANFGNKLVLYVIEGQVYRCCQLEWAGQRQGDKQDIHGRHTERDEIDAATVKRVECKWY